MGQWIGCTVLCAAGLLSMCMGWQIGWRQRTDLIHGIHTRHVLQKDVPAYTRAMGLSLLWMGAGFAAAGITLLFCTAGWALAPVALVLGIAGIVRAQRKYNGSVV